MALYFSVQKPVQRAAPRRGDAAAGEALSTACGGCHGARGVSRDTQTPSLAGQDFDYLVRAIKAYRTVRKNWGMQRYIAGLSEKDVDDIVAFYTTQAPRASEQKPTPTQELAAKCDRCHDDDSNPSMAAPKMRGQNKDYLVMALRNYRDDGDRETCVGLVLHGLNNNDTTAFQPEAVKVDGSVRKIFTRMKSWFDEL